MGFFLGLFKAVAAAVWRFLTNGAVKTFLREAARKGLQRGAQALATVVDAVCPRVAEGLGVSINGGAATSAPRVAEVVGVSLKEAATSAPRGTGVYTLYLNGQRMKIGKAAWKAGLRWRLQQYWRGDATAGRFRKEITANRDNIRVVWEAFEAADCRQAELASMRAAGGVANLPWCVVH